MMLKDILETLTLPIPIAASGAILAGMTLVDYVLWGTALMLTLNLLLKLHQVYKVYFGKDKDDDSC